MNTNLNRRDRYLNRRKNREITIGRRKKQKHFSFLNGAKNSIKIFRRDMKAIFNSWVTMVIIAALIVLPALYAWFNIKACWDPYGNTSALSVAVVNLDKGAMYRDIKVTAGADIVKQLENNKKIGWKFVSKSEAANGVKYGTYYASITIPESFSKNLLSIITDEVPTKATMIYSVNEKTNAIAEKITDKGSSSLQDEVTRAFIQTASDKVMSILNQLGVELENNKPVIKNIIDTIIDLDSKMPEIGENIDNAYNASVVFHQYIKNVQGDIPTISDTLNKSTALAQSNSDNVKKMQASLDKLVASLENQQAVIKNSENTTKLLLTNTQNYSPLDFNNAKQILTTVDGSVSNSINKIDNNIINLKLIEDSLNKNGDISSTAAIDKLINDLTDIKNNLQNQRSNVKNTIESIDTGADSVQKLVPAAINKALDNANQAVNSINNVVDDFNKNTVPAMQSTMASFVGISNNTLSLLQSAQGNLPLISSLLDASEYGAGEGEKTLLDIKNKFPEIQSIVHKNADKLKSLNEDKRYDEVVKLLKKNAKDESEFLAEPVKLTENKVYAIPNYGSAMSPFYTTLAIWVGSFIVLALLSVEVNNFEDGKDLRPVEKYFGRYFTILAIAILQAVVVTLGDIFLLKAYVVSPGMFVVFSIYVAIIFSIFIYTNVSVFGNVGKAIIMIALVLQVSASGGTFPIELTPSFFQDINPLLPFKYAIGGMRETVAGILPEALLYNISALAVYLIIALLAGIFLKGIINRVLHRFVKQFKESGLVGE